MLPPGATLQDYDILTWRPQSSTKGLAGIHGNFNISTQKLYFCVAVWSDGDPNGISVPTWQPWQNTCATLYKELMQFRTNPDIDSLPAAGPTAPGVTGWATWYTPPPAGPGQWMEIGNTPTLWATAVGIPSLNYATITTQSGVIAPIHVLWSNTIKSPYYRNSNVLNIQITNQSDQTVYVRFTSSGSTLPSLTIESGQMSCLPVASFSAGRIYLSLGKALTTDSPDAPCVREVAARIGSRPQGALEDEHGSVWTDV